MVNSIVSKLKERYGNNHIDYYLAAPGYDFDVILLLNLIDGKVQILSPARIFHSEYNFASEERLLTHITSQFDTVKHEIID